MSAHPDHKHPDKAQAFSTSFGSAYVLYLVADEQRCTAAILLEVDAVAPVRRGKGKSRGGALDAALAQCGNDCPYGASSLLAVALSKVSSSVTHGGREARPERDRAAPPPRRGPGAVRRPRADVAGR